MILLTLLFTFSQGFKRATVISTVHKDDAAGFAVIELFTSEGCSSCPAADEAVEKFLKQNSKQVYVLAFHVDYWNKLGWKDIFSKPFYTARQNQYATVFGLESAYTPQIVVNGKYEFVGSNSSQLKRVVDKELTNGMGKPVNLSAAALSNNRVLVNYQLNEKMDANLNIALVQLHASSDVKRGENEGRHLEHINVVRDFKILAAAALTGKAELDMPAGTAKDDCKIIAYLQDPVSMQISGVAEIKIR
jgi:hypothetical protein